MGGDESPKWRFCATDIAEALTKSCNPHCYWNALERRKNELSTTEIKGKRREVVFNRRCGRNGVTSITALIHAKNEEIF